MRWLAPLRLPEVRDVVDLDDPAVTELHRRIIERKPFLRRLYVDTYRELERWLPQRRPRRIIELGSGGGFIKQVIPDAVTSDVLDVAGLDLRFSALDMPFENESVDAFCMIDVLHHLPDARRFLAEADRCLRRGGRLVMIEPANTAWSRFVYQRFHHEAFDPEGSWSPQGRGPLSTANGAIPWIVFVRDRREFDRAFPHLEVIHLRPHTPVRYLLSGGLSMRQLAPSFAYAAVKGLEAALRPLDAFLGMFYTVVVQRNGQPSSGKPVPARRPSP